MKYKLCYALVVNSKVDIPTTGRILGYEKVPPVGKAPHGEPQTYEMLVWYLMEDEA